MFGDLWNYSPVARSFPVASSCFAVASLLRGRRLYSRTCLCVRRGMHISIFLAVVKYRPLQDNTLLRYCRHICTKTGAPCMGIGAWCCCGCIACMFGLRDPWRLASINLPTRGYTISKHVLQARSFLIL